MSPVWNRKQICVEENETHTRQGRVGRMRSHLNTSYEAARFVALQHRAVHFYQAREKKAHGAPRWVRQLLPEPQCPARLASACSDRAR
ncbi:hypothetical protein RRG08_032982 [Elysia crispata]|uniref:Uncharacterized protein n=1 Tax=Elysia crispata TaxID=231223 RepID=A0AAE1D3L0_9GAST|nr:hypothetical protein RRG08_032982 [Elysia crispata]